MEQLSLFLVRKDNSTKASPAYGPQAEATAPRSSTGPRKKQAQRRRRRSGISLNEGDATAADCRSAGPQGLNGTHRVPAPLQRTDGQQIPLDTSTVTQGRRLILCIFSPQTRTFQFIQQLTKRPWCWERLKAGGEGADRGWDGWMASPTRWTWVWVNSGSWWWTGRPGVLQSMGSQRIGHDWATELNRMKIYYTVCWISC